MCQYAISHHISPCNTFIYYLTHRCRSNIGPGRRCMVVNLRQKHVRNASPCGHPFVCDWCRRMSFGDGGELWNEAKPTPYGHGAGGAAGFPLIINPEALSIPIMSAQLVQTGAEVGVGPVEYDGTTYYVSSEEFQRRILPQILERRRRKAAKRQLRVHDAVNRTSSIGEEGSPGTGTGTSSSTSSSQPLELTALGTTHCFNPEAEEYKPTQRALEEGGFLSFQDIPYSQWKFYEGPAQRGKPVMVVNFGALPAELIGGTTMPYYAQDLYRYDYMQPQWLGDWGYNQPQWLCEWGNNQPQEWGDLQHFN